MSGNETAMKFVRAHQAADGMHDGIISQYYLKLIYEFWGFCVNGGNSLLNPGGFASTGYLNMAPGFESGSAVLLASGSDGATTLGTNVFTAPSVNWTSGSIIGKCLVTWQSGSSSTDDSVYQITQVISSSSIAVNVLQGGTPQPTASNQLAFTTRSSINYRVVDLHAAGNLPGAHDGNNMILQFNAGAINAGQAASQVELSLGSGGHTDLSAVSFTLSPSGSWNGTTFSDASPALPPDNGDWFFPNGSGVTNFVSLWADQASLMMQTRGSYAPAGTSFQIEIPIRLFPANVDPNPICCYNSGDAGQSNSVANEGDLHFGSGWLLPVPNDNATLRRHFVLTPNLSGDTTANPGSTSLANTNNVVNLAAERFKEAYYNVRTKSTILLGCVLAHRQVGTSFTMGRVRLRQARISPFGYSSFDTKIGQRGEWISLGYGLLWPWDNAQLPHSLFPSGTG